MANRKGKIETMAVSVLINMRTEFECIVADQR